MALKWILIEATKFALYGVVFAILGRIFDYAFAMLVFCPLRQFTGGYHAKTYWGCMFVTLSLFVAGIYLPMLFQIDLAAKVLIILAGYILIFKVVPVDTVKIPIQNPVIRQKCKRRALATFSIISVITVYLHFAALSFNLFGRYLII